MKSVYSDGEMYRVDNPEVYITPSGALYMLCSQEWVNYLGGRTDDIPDNTKKVEVEDLL